MMNHKIGDRVFFITDRSRVGKIVSDVFKSPKTGEDRQEVLWDRSQRVTSWAPQFLIPVNTPENEIPEIVVSENLIYRKATGEIYRINSRNLN